MNAYTTRGQARIQPRDFSAVLRANGLAGASLARLEWQRGCQADAEAEWLLRFSSRVTPQASGSIVSVLRQTIGAALMRAGERLAGIPHSGISPDLASAAAGTHGGTPAR